MNGVPNRGTSELDLDRWNRQLRQSPVYLDFMKRYRLPLDGRVTLSREQQAALERDLARAGTPIPGGMHIDQGGNLNQKNRLGRNAAITAAAAAAAVGGAAALGAFSGGGAAGGGAAAGASTLPSVASGIGTTGGYGSLFSGTGAFLGGGGAVVPAAVAPAAATGGAMKSLLFTELLGLGRTGVGLYANNRATKAQMAANKYAAELEAKALADRLQFEKDTAAENKRRDDEAEAYKRRIDAETEQRRRYEYDREQAQLQAAWEAQEARRAPYRQMSEGAAAMIAAHFGLPFTPSAQVRSVRPPDMTLSEMVRGGSGPQETSWPGPLDRPYPPDATGVTANQDTGVRWGPASPIPSGAAMPTGQGDTTLSQRWPEYSGSSEWMRPQSDDMWLSDLVNPRRRVPPRIGPPRQRTPAEEARQY